MSPNNDDVVKVDLTPEETSQVASKPIEAKAEVKAETVTEPVKAEIKEPVKEVKEVKPIRFEEVFNEKPEAEVQEMTVDERSEYETLKKAKVIEEHQNAFERELEIYVDKEDREIIQNRLDKLLKKTDANKTDFFDILSGVLDPKKVAYIFTAIAEREEREVLEKARAKRLNTAVKTAETNATKSAEVKKTLTEIADLSTVGDKGELSPSEKHRQLVKKGYSGNHKQRNEAIDGILDNVLSNK